MDTFTIIQQMLMIRREVIKAKLHLHTVSTCQVKMLRHMHLHSIAKQLHHVAHEVSKLHLHHAINWIGCITTPHGGTCIIVTMARQYAQIRWGS